MVADAVNGMEVPGFADLVRQFQIGKAPTRAAVAAAEQHQAALPHRHAALGRHVQTADVAAAERFHVGQAEALAAVGGQAVPATCQCQGTVVGEVGGQPRRAARPLDRFPAAATVLGHEQAGRQLVGTVAGDVASLGIEEADEVQPRHRVEQDTPPFPPAVVGEQQHAAAAGAVGQLLAADRPADGRRFGKEVDRPQRGAHAGGLALPIFPAVDAVPDHALVADRPAFLVVHELNGIDAGVVEIAQAVGAHRRRGQEQNEGAHDGRGTQRDGSHEWPSIRVGRRGQGRTAGLAEDVLSGIGGAGQDGSLSDELTTEAQRTQRKALALLCVLCG